MKRFASLACVSASLSSRRQRSSPTHRSLLCDTSHTPSLQAVVPHRLTFMAEGVLRKPTPITLAYSPY